MMKTIAKALMVSAAVLTMSATAAAAPAKITASIDSTVVEMGSHAMITLNIVDPSHSGRMVGLPESGYQAPDYDIVKVDSSSTQSGYTYNVTVQPFVPGMLTLMPFKYAVGTDTAASDVVTLKVLAVELDSVQAANLTINDMEGTVNPPRRWYDYLPEWFVPAILIMLLLALIGLGIYVYYTYRKTGHIAFVKPKPIDPYAEAMDALSRLREQHLAENGHEKEYYTRLIDILRRYMQLRFNINAMEMSSTQILASLRQNPETRDNQPRIKQILDIADMVKFAKERPLPDDNIKSYNTVYNFVETTKPLPEPDDDEKNGKGKKVKGNDVKTSSEKSIK